MIKILVLWAVIIFSACASAENIKLKIPRFVTIKSNEVNARTGPAINCPIEWVFTKKGEPVEITAEYEQWRLIRDIKGEGGWVHSSVLSGKRSIIVTDLGPISLYKELGNENKIIAKVHQNVRCNLNKCKGKWCYVKCRSYEGWMNKKLIWGVYEEEI